VRHSGYLPWREWPVIALLLTAAGVVLWWAMDLSTPWFRWLVFAVTVAPTAIVLLSRPWCFRFSCRCC
jgi:hypothetical protein